jgi:uncharacterized RDD family membrane protein YckC
MAVMLYDTLLLLGVLLVLFLIPQILFSMATQKGVAGPVLLLHVFTVTAAYFVWFWLHGGQTLAMKTWKVRIVATDRPGLGIGQSLLRFTLAWVSLLAGGLGIFWAFFDPEKQFLHDRLAGTRIIWA